MSSRPFAERHIGTSASEQQIMLQTMGLTSLDELTAKTIPAVIRTKNELQLPPAIGENQFLEELKTLAGKNQIFRNYIGMGYYGAFMPPVIQRAILENPGWYTAYTPYQAEISQGRLEMLFLFQTILTELSGFPLAGASLLDEATAAAEVMAMFHAFRKAQRQTGQQFGLIGSMHPQTMAVVKTRAHWLGIEVREFQSLQEMPTDLPELFGVLIQNPDGEGKVHDLRESISRLHSANIQVAVAGDVMAQMLFQSPGDQGADAAIGCTQRFGLPLGNGGPHAGWMACKDDYKRFMPGRIIGLSKDAQGKPAYRMALGTREQHIRREKATSNLCTSQVLPAVLSTAYVIYHGPVGLRCIAERIHQLTLRLAQGLSAQGIPIRHTSVFDTLKIAASPFIFEKATSQRINLRYFVDGDIGISLDETTTEADVIQLAALWNAPLASTPMETLPTALQRDTTGLLPYPAFHLYQSEHALLRYLKRLENKDISLTHSMIPLGSCTMKLNAAAEMIPFSWPEFANIHPFAPMDQKQGTLELTRNLEQYLAECTRFAGVSLMPNSGAQGEYTGLIVIRSYQASCGQGQRKIALIPASAHGTNPASAALAGLTVVTVKCDSMGNIDICDLRNQAEKYGDSISVLMVTYPSTHGVFEEAILEIRDIVHGVGAQLYMDGANMNAQVGLTAPGIIGADVCHLNLHKTFAIPHGGGGPGSGPIAVAKHLVPFLPMHPVVDGCGQNAVSAAPWGSAMILTISYGYIRMMGAAGLKAASQNAILNANYLRQKLAPYYPVLYTGKYGFCAHEFILDCQGFKNNTGIEAGDIARRLMDFGFHAPTVSFPVHNTLMIEPTESEPLAELDRFAEALIQIRAEIQAVAEGKFSRDDNMIHNAPHTLQELLGEWHHAYSREDAAFPLPWLRDGKPWASVSQIDHAYGDRNLVCSCGSMGG